MNMIDEIQADPVIERFVDRSFDIVDRLQSILDQKRLTQRQLAEILGKKESQVSKWMSGTHNFTLKSIMKLEVVLDQKLIEISESSIPISEENQPIEVDFSFVRRRFKENPVDCKPCMDGLNTPYFDRVKEFEELTYSN